MSHGTPACLAAFSITARWAAASALDLFSYSSFVSLSICGWCVKTRNFGIAYRAVTLAPAFLANRMPRRTALSDSREPSVANSICLNIVSLLYMFKNRFARLLDVLQQPSHVLP